MRTALICDVHSLYVGGQKQFPGRSLNYAKLVETCEDLGFDLFQKIAFGRQPVNKVRGFATALEALGFELVFNNKSHETSIALLFAELVHTRSVDQIVLATNDPVHAQLLNFARLKGIYTAIFTFCPCDVLIAATQNAYLLEHDSLLEAAEPQLVSADSPALSERQTA